MKQTLLVSMYAKGRHREGVNERGWLMALLHQTDTHTTSHTHTTHTPTDTRPLFAVRTSQPRICANTLSRYPLSLRPLSLSLSFSLFSLTLSTIFLYYFSTLLPLSLFSLSALSSFSISHYSALAQSLFSLPDQLSGMPPLAKQRVHSVCARHDTERGQWRVRGSVPLQRDVRV